MTDLFQMRKNLMEVRIDNRAIDIHSLLRLEQYVGIIPSSFILVIEKRNSEHFSGKNIMTTKSIINQQHMIQSTLKMYFANFAVLAVCFCYCRYKCFNYSVRYNKKRLASQFDLIFGDLKKRWCVSLFLPPRLILKVDQKVAKSS